MTEFNQNNLNHNEPLRANLAIRKSLKTGFGRFIRAFVFITLFILIVINWQTVKEIFNYKKIYTDIIDSIKGDIAISNPIKIPEIRLSEPTKEIKYQAPFTEKTDSIEIPAIGITAPLVFIDSTDNKDYDKALKNGVVRYATSATPDQKGQTMFLGHSAPAGWPHINYDWVFSKLNDLNPGDEIIINYKNGEYRYKMTEKYFLKQGDDVPNSDLTNSKYMVVLISCWPPGVNYKRIAIEAELIK